MIEYKAVAMDLDDTLLTSDLQISEETKQTLLQCQKDGMHVILASGRPIYAIRNMQKSWNWRNMAAILWALMGRLSGIVKQNV